MGLNLDFCNKLPKNLGMTTVIPKDHNIFLEQGFLMGWDKLVGCNAQKSEEKTSKLMI
jgi:hypothetical protein